MAVAQVVEGVKADAQLTFDFLVMLIIAGYVIKNCTMFKNSKLVFMWDQSTLGCPI